jgi:hypothetical protein
VTDTDTTETPAEGEHYPVERWTYGGHAAGAKTPKLEVWYTTDRTRLLYKPEPGRAYVTGCVYEMEVRREPRDDGEGVVTRRMTWPAFVGQEPDRDWASQIQADAYANERELAADALEKRIKRSPGPLEDVLAAVEKAAAPMTYAQRDALIAMLTRRVYRANLGRTR